MRVENGVFTIFKKPKYNTEYQNFNLTLRLPSVKKYCHFISFFLKYVRFLFGIVYEA